MIYLSWDSEAVNRTLNVPPMYRVYKEYQKPQNEQNCELLKYRYDFLKTIVEAIKTVSTINIFSNKGLRSHFIFEINVGKSRIRHGTTPSSIDLSVSRASISESFYVGSASFRH